MQEEKEKAQSYIHLKWEDFPNVICTNREEAIMNYLLL
jgi:hypothetical protein